jgi:hypothetical protein
MAKFYPIRDLIDSAIALDVANPNFAISDKETLLKEAAIKLGTMDYYRFFPLRTTMCTAYSSDSGYMSTFNWSSMVKPKMEDGMLVIPFDDALSKASPAIPKDQLDNAYFMGVMRVERPAWNTLSNPSMWSMQMFGIQVGNSNFDITSTLLSNTMDDLSTGQPRYTINRTKDQIEVLIPWGFGMLSWDLAVGFTSPEYVEPSKANHLLKFISYRFIESIIQARSGVQLDADFKISTDALNARLDKLKEDIDSLKQHAVLSIAQWN